MVAAVELHEGQVPPHDQGAEQAVLSACLLDALALDAAAALLEPAHFYSEAHRRIFEACLDLHARAQPVDSVQIATWLKDRDRLQQAGGLPYIAKLLGAAPALAVPNVTAYARTVLEKSRRRELIFAAHRITAGGYLDREPLDSFAARALHEVRRIAEACGAANAPVIETLSVADVFRPQPPIRWLVEGLRLAPGAAAALVGYGYVGKTITAQSLALSCASGRSALGVFGVQTCRVKHFDYEQGEYLTRKRYQRLARGMGIDPRELDDRLRVAIHPATYLDSPGAEDVFARAFDGCGLVIVDSLRAAAPSADENSSEVRRFIDVLTRAGEKTGALPLFLHHARKPSEQARGGAKMSIRGSSAIFDACASVFILEAEKGQPARVHHEKERIAGATLPDFGLRVEDVEVDGDPHGGLRVVHVEAEQLDDDGDTREGTSARRHAALVARVRDHLAANPDVPGIDVLARQLGARTSDVRAAWSELLARGEVTNAGAANRPRFRLVKGGHDAP